jgi:flagellar biosynthesis/type III secretory pathway protein FliH
MPAKKKASALDRAAEIGVSIPTLNSWKRCGVNINSDEEVRLRIGRMRNIPPTLKPEFMPKLAAKIEAPGEDPTQIDIEAIIRQLSNVTDKHQAQTVKIQIDGLLNAYKLREAAGQYVSKSTVKSAILRITSAVNAMMQRMVNDLPPMLEGLRPESMEEIIAAKVDEAISYLRDIESIAYEKTERQE